MGLRVSLAEMFRPPLPARPPKPEADTDRPDGGFQGYLAALSPHSKPAADVGGDSKSSVKNAARSEKSPAPSTDDRTGRPKEAKDENSPATDGTTQTTQAADSQSTSATVSAEPAQSSALHNCNSVTSAQACEVIIPIFQPDKTVSGTIGSENDGAVAADSNSGKPSSTPVSIEASNTGPPAPSTNQAAAIVSASLPVPAAHISGAPIEPNAEAPTANIVPPEAEEAQSSAPVQEPRRPIRNGDVKPDTTGDRSRNEASAVRSNDENNATPQAVGSPAPSGRVQATRETVIAASTRPTLADPSVNITIANQANDNLQTQSRGPNQGGSPKASSADVPVARHEAPAATLESHADLKAITVRTSSGDDVAANVGRFLLGGSTDSARATSEAPSSDAAGHATQVAAHSATPSEARAAVVTNLDGLLSSINEAGSPDQSARILSGSNGPDHHHATLQLDPPELGELRIAIRMDAHGMTIRVDAESAAAAKLIESRLPELRDALTVSGIHVARSEVVLRSPETSGGHRDQHTNHRSGSEPNSQSQHQPSTWLNDGQRSGDPRHGAEWSGGAREEWSPRGDDERLPDEKHEVARLPRQPIVAGSLNLVA